MIVSPHYFVKVVLTNPTDGGARDINTFPWLVVTSRGFPYAASCFPPHTIMEIPTLTLEMGDLSSFITGMEHHSLSGLFQSPHFLICISHLVYSHSPLPYSF